MLENNDIKSKSIGFAGIGIMGSAMAGHIHKAGFDLTIYNRTKTKDSYKNLVDNGVKESESIKNLAVNCDVIFTCLDDEVSVISAVTEMLPNLKEGAIIVDTTTIGKKAAIEASEILRDRKCIFLDAPLTGGDKGAKAGNLTVIVGGERQYFDYLIPLFETFGSLIKFCGEVGSGQAVKSINQLLCAVNLTGVCEAFIAAEKMNVDPELVIEICSSGMAGSKQLTALGSEIVKNNFNPGFKARHLAKDLRLLLEEVEKEQIEITSSVFNKFKKITKDEEAGELGTQILYKYLSNKQEC